MVDDLRELYSSASIFEKALLGVGSGVGPGGDDVDGACQQ